MSNDPIPTPKELSIAIAELKAAQEELHRKHLRFWRLTDDLPREHRPPTSDRVQMGQALEDFRIAMIRSTVQARGFVRQGESIQTVFISKLEMAQMYEVAVKIQTPDLDASQILPCLLYKALKSKGYSMSKHWIAQEETPNGFYFKFGDSNQLEAFGIKEET